MTESNPTATPPPARILVKTHRGRLLMAASWLYSAIVLVALGMIRWLGGEWWCAAVILFAPRWIFLAPIALLAVACAVRRTFAPWFVLTATTIVVLGPFMGLNLPFAERFQSVPDGLHVRAATYNLARKPLPAVSLVSWLDTRKIDVICFQEGGREEDEVRKQLREAGWHLSEKRTVASRFPMLSEMPLLADDSAGDDRYPAVLERVRLRIPGGGEFVVASVHLPTLRPGFERLFQNRELAALKMQQEWWRQQLARVLTALAEVNDAPLLVAGDFNMPADDTALAALQANFRFAFEEAGWGYGYTRPTKTPWVRIDHILTGPDWGIVSCHVGPDLGSDHLPLWAEVVLPK